MRFHKSHRTRVAEWMDADDADPLELGRALRFIRRINALLGYNRAMVDSIRREIGPGTGEEALRVLDVAAGSGDLLLDLHAWSTTLKGRPLELIGIDRHAETITEGLRVCPPEADVRFIRGDALSLPFEDASIDVVTSTLFLHHLSDEAATQALREMRRVARRAVVIADLIRSRRAYLWITLFTLTAGPMVRHDARASVAHAFTLQELGALAVSAGMEGAKVTRAFGHRSALVWRRM